MKKRFLSLALALVLCLPLLPGMALAATTVDLKVDLKKDFFNNGKLVTPEKPYLDFVERGDFSNDSSVINVFYDQTSDFLAMADAVAKYNDTSSDGDYLRTVCNVGYDYDRGFQFDVKFDNGTWYSEQADYDNFDYGELSNSSYFWCYQGLDFDNTTKLQAFTYQMTLDSENPAILSPYAKEYQNADGETKYILDLANHTVSYRIRSYITYDKRDENDDLVELVTLFSDWSSVASIGKNGNQKQLVQPTKIEAPKLSQFSLVTNNEGHVEVKYYIDFPDSVYDGVRYHNVLDAGKSYYDTPYTLQAQIKKVGGDWANVYTLNPFWLTDGYRSAGGDAGINADEKVQLRVRIETSFPEGNSEWSNIIGNIAEHQASAWAQAELAEADALGLIPEVLQGEDLTKPITRAEFAAVAVKVYENLSGEKAVPVVDNPFTDTNDVEVLKAKNVGITDGTSKTTFAPNVILNREQCATMLTRVFKKVSIAGWTLDTDSSFNDTFKAMFTMPAAFADDKDISGWAKDSVYFMKAKGIIDGVGNSMFAPKHGITVNEAANYGLATREHALLIAVRMVKNLPVA